MSTMSERLHTTELYLPGDETVMREQLQYLDLLHEFNAIPPSHVGEKTEMMKKMFAEVGEGCYIETPMRANWGGHHVHLGKNVYANFNLTLARRFRSVNFNNSSPWKSAYTDSKV